MKQLKSIFILLIFLLSLGSGFAAIGDRASISTSLINQDPDPANAGDIVELRIGVTNSGSESANNVIIEIAPEYPFSLVDGQTNIQKIDSILAYQGASSENTIIVKYKIKVDKDATSGSYDLKVKVYPQGSSSTTSQTLKVDVQNKDSAEIIYIDQVELIPGKITPLKFTINNVGSAPLRDMTFQWENQDDIILPVGSDNTKYIKFLDVGQKIDLAFNVIASASADPDLYKLDLTLTYDDSSTNTQKSTSTKAGIYVGGATDFDVAYSGTTNGEASFSISNIGSVSASSVTVKIPEQNGWKVSGSNSAIIGNLNKGDYTIASFTLTKTDVKMSTIDIEIDYTDSRGERGSIIKEVTISDGSSTTRNMTSTSFNRANGQSYSTTTSSSTSNNSIMYLIIIIVLILLLYTYGKYNKVKRIRTSYKFSDALKDTLKLK